MWASTKYNGKNWKQTSEDRGCNGQIQIQLVANCQSFQTCRAWPRVANEEINLWDLKGRAGTRTAGNLPIQPKNRVQQIGRNMPSIGPFEERGGRGRGHECRKVPTAYSGFQRCFYPDKCSSTGKPTKKSGSKKKSTKKWRKTTSILVLFRSVGRSVRFCHLKKTLRAILLGQKINEPPKRHLGPHMDRKRMERLLMGSEIPRPTTRNGAKTWYPNSTWNLKMMGFQKESPFPGTSFQLPCWISVVWMGFKLPTSSG